MVFKAGNIPWVKGKHPIPWNKGKTGLQVAWNKGMTGKKSHMFGKHQSEKTKWKRSGERHPLFEKGHTPESIQKMRENHADFRGEKGPMFGKHHTDKSKQKISKANLGKPSFMKGKHHTLESKQKNRETHKELWQDEVFAKKMIEKFQLKPNGSELYLDSILQNNFPDEWWFVGDGQMTLSGLCPDFVNVNGKKQIIELFGEHCHTDGGIFTGEKTPHRRTEQGRKEAFAKHGYSTLIIWYNELKDENKVIEKIRGFI